jgi:outer membrane protein
MVTLAALVVTAPAHAVDWAIGLGAGYAPDYEGSEDYQVVPLWSLRASDLYGSTTYVDVFATRLTSNLVAHPNLRFGPMLELIPERDDVEDDAVDDLKKVDPALRLKRNLGDQLSLAGGISWTYANEGYMSDYFSIDADNAARSGLDQHDGDAGFKDAGADLALGFGQGPGWQASLIGRYRRLLDDVADSPIVADEDQLFAGVLVGYRF